jgi:hypothetical protein
MNLSSIILLSSVLLSGLWGYDSPARSSVTQENLSQHACLSTGQKMYRFQ